jgi:hypothetical protein
MRARAILSFRPSTSLKASLRPFGREVTPSAWLFIGPAEAGPYRDGGGLPLELGGRLWLSGAGRCAGTGGVAGPSAAAREVPRAFAQDDGVAQVLGRAVRFANAHVRESGHGDPGLGLIGILG